MEKMMPSSILTLIIVVLFIVEKSTICCLAIKNNVTFDCFPIERKALLTFRASFSDDQSNNMMSSWKTNSDCCGWPGVKCDNAATRHVVGLHLRNRHLNSNSKLRSKAVDSSLLELKYLSYLDLSGNDFQGSLIPSFLGSMKQLQYLNLSNAGFGGTVPNRLGNLSSLRTLDLGGSGYGNNLIVDDLTWAINLSSLEYLDMSNVNLNAVKDLVKVLGMLPSLLKYLRLPNCGLDNTNTDCANATFFTNNVQHLDLSNNSFGENSSFCFLHNMTSQSFLDLSRNKLSGPIPSPIGNLISLKVLDLSCNSLSGPISHTLENLIDLRVLNLSHNSLSGSIPFTFGNLRVLRVLDLSFNQLSGEVPVSLGKLSNLERVCMLSNSFKGTLSKTHFAKLSKLEDIRVGSNYELKLRVGYDWVPHFHQLKILDLRSVDIGGQFPQWLETQKSLIQLCLSNCSITGTLPKWVVSFMNMTALVLPNNHIEGPIPELPSSLIWLNLAKNFINGLIPDLLCEMKALGGLDLSENHLSGDLSNCLWNLDSLRYVRLSSNQFSGHIPNSIGRAYRLQFLQLHNNSLTGVIPSSLRNCIWLLVLDIGDNKLYGKLPEWIGNHLLHLAAIRLRNNKIYGDISSAYCQLPRLRIMDFAHNQLTGNIPNCFGNLSGMAKDGGVYAVEILSSGVSLNEMMKGVMMEYNKSLAYLVNLDLSSNHLFGKIPPELTNLTGLNGLNLSRNHLGGTIPEKIGDMSSLESLDLSCNNLHGTIPLSLSKLNFLSHLNLSGQIPTGPQLQTLNNYSSYEGNRRLCGDPLPWKCHITNIELPEFRKVENDDIYKIYLYASIITGIAIGFWSYFGVLIFKRRWRLALFQYMDALIGKMLGRNSSNFSVWLLLILCCMLLVQVMYI